MSDNIIEIDRRRVEQERVDLRRQWRARAAADPDWAARQIQGLLDRALAAEKALREERGQAHFPMPTFFNYNGSWFWTDDLCEGDMGPFESHAEAVADLRACRRERERGL